MKPFLPSLTAAQLEAVRELAIGEGWAEPADRDRIECAVVAVDRDLGASIRLVVSVRLPFPPPTRGTRILGRVELGVGLPPENGRA